ncbi:DMT family transporter [Dongia soli]|uniref:DMT family transporter n=1 Tax=Dongia soli TaxID=600628 RepID=A0ABU5EBA6_9PROT|nr:DMT family transporter [Dongia soli]MDY0883162.1 DMT family transporter [Dongia soli]
MSFNAVSPLPSAPHLSGRDWALLIALSIIWGGSFFFAKIAIQELPPLTVALGRVGIGAIALILILLASGQAFPRDLRLWRDFLIMGLLNNMIPFSLIFWGQQHIASGLASILNATTPLFTLILAQILTHDDRITAPRLGGIALGFLGVAVMIGPDALQGFSLNLGSELAILGAALSYGFAGIFGRRFRGLSPLLPATGQVTCSALLLLPIVCVVDRPWALPMPGTVTCIAVFGLGLLCTALAYVIFFRILRSAGPTNLALVTFLIPVSALLLGISILGEDVAPRHFGGMALIFAGLAVIDGRLFARLKPA